MSYIIYHQSLESATLTYSATADTNYPVTNLQDRYKNTFFKDTAIGLTEVNIKVDFGTARTCNYILFWNYLITPSSGLIILFSLEYSSTGEFSGEQGTAIPYWTENIYKPSLGNYLKTFASKSYRYWRFRFQGADSIIDKLQIGAIYLGAQITLSHSPEINDVYSANYDVNINQGVGGIRAGSIDNTTVRRIWQYQWKLLNTTDKTNLETFRDSVFMNKGLSRYPFIWSPDSGTTLYSARTNGELSLKQTAFEAYEWNAVFEEGL